MAKRDALRELQTRLAERMQDAQRSPSRALSWLAVECRGHGLLFPLHQAGEIFALVPVLAVPHTQPWFAGVANLRGGVFGVIDLARFLGIAAVPGQRDPSHLVALNASLGLNCALLVDRLAGLRSSEQLAAQPAGDGVRPPFAGARYRDDQGRDWQEILLADLAADERFLAIAG